MVTMMIMIARRLILPLGLAALVSACSLVDRLIAPPAPLVRSVTVQVLPDTLSPGQTAEAVAIPRDSSGTALNGQVPFWASSDPSVATVSSSGHVVAVKAGSDTVRAAIGVAIGIAVVTVR